MTPLDPWTMDLEGTSLIEASAGTGKTYTLTTLYLRLLVEHDLTPDQILVVTFTEAATAELRERLRKRLQAAIAEGEGAGEGAEPEPGSEEAHLRALVAEARARAAASGRPDALREALSRFDEAAISTIHGFCSRTLQENAFESGLPFDAELVERSEPVERTLAHDLFRRLIAEQDDAFVEWLRVGEGKRWKIDPDGLYDEILRLLGADEEMPVVPPPAAPVGDDAETARVAAAAMRAWARVWLERGEAVTSLLVGAEGLNKTSYKAQTIESGWVPDLDALAAEIAALGGDDARITALALPACFGRLTPDALAAKTNKGHTPPEDPAFELFAAVDAAVTALGASRDARALALRQRFVALAREEAARRREEQHLLFFDDLLSELRRALHGAGGALLRRRLRARHRFALIDEFQDTDPVQYDVFRRVWHEREPEDAAQAGGLILIGDPKQAIYAFRGADVFTYLSAQEQAAGRVHGLATNWRSDPGLIHAVNALFEGVSDPFRNDRIGFEPVHVRPGFTPDLAPAGHPAAGLRVLFGDRAALRAAAGESTADDDAKAATKSLAVRYGRTQLMEAVATDIVALLESGAQVEGRPVAPSDIAILCRRKMELQQARRALEAAGVPCVDRGDADVFETREAWELACVLDAMLRPADPARVRAALATGPHGLPASQIAALEDDAPELAEWSERYAEWGRRWLQSGFGPAFEAWRREARATPRLLALGDGERRVTNWLHLAELLQRFESDRHPSRAGLLDALERAIGSSEARAVFGGDASLLRLERDDQAVELVTLHRSKGLEYPFVYLPSLWEAWASRGPSVASAKAGTTRQPVRYHDAEHGRRTLDLSGHDAYAEHLEQSVEETFSEQLRLLYVGLTRARHQCVVAWAAIGEAAGTPMAWLLDVEAAGEPRSKSKDRRAKWSDDDWWAAWSALADRAARAEAGAEGVSIEAARVGASARWTPPADRVPALDFAARSRILERRIRTTSFSALTREGHRVDPPSGGPEIEGRDLDPASAAERGVGAVSDAAAEAGVGAASDAAAQAEPQTTADLTAEMHAFPRGADAGTLLHDVLEAADLAAIAAGTASRDALLALAVERLDRNGLDRAHADQVLHVVESVARTPLRPRPGGDGFRLGDVAPGALRAEVEFTLTTPGGEDGAALDPEALAALLAGAPSGSPLARYAERAGRLGFRRLAGFLRGFIDAVFFDGERYFLVDYKSNHLGVRQSDYAPEALVEPMLEHDYVLQYLLYSVALDRHLAVRLADYDYERHFGGAYYLFLRGFALEHAPGCGVFHDRPPRELVRGLSALLGEAERATGGGGAT